MDYKKIFHFIFPPSEDELRVGKTTTGYLLALFPTSRTGNTTILLPYTHPTVRSTIHLLKFHNHTKARTLLGSILATHLKNITFPKKEYLLVPIPLSATRLRQRGYNQTAEVIKEACIQGAPGKLTNNILKRTRNTIPQASLTREKRLTNLKGAFVAKSKNLSGAHIILIDDVTTTGATLNEARAALLLLSPASITCIALAH